MSLSDTNRSADESMGVVTISGDSSIDLVNYEATSGASFWKRGRV